MSKSNGIVAMNPEKYREIDGVVFDLASYERHCQPKEAEAPQSAAPAPVFVVDPYPDGWYPADDERPPVPIMGGAMPSAADREAETGEVTITQTVCVPCGSGSGSFLTSYVTSYRTSFSGSGSYAFGSGLVGGYGLELI